MCREAQNTVQLKGPFCHYMDIWFQSIKTYLTSSG